MSPPKTAPIRIKTEDDQIQVLPGTETTPPPSPGSTKPRVDTEGIKDEVVVGAIRQLEKTGNRPHTSKELAAALATCVPTIEQYVSHRLYAFSVSNILNRSTNPNALIQARLATYLKGPWPLVSPCPIGKEQENVHPRRVFYFLTCMPHQPIPDTTLLQQQARRIISPSLTSDEEMEAKHSRDRTQPSPSPEVDLSSPELDEDNDNELASMYSSRSSLSQSHPGDNLSHNRRAVSPPLEREERDFKQTANQLQQQRRDSQRKSRQTSETSAKVEQEEGKASPMSVDAAEESEETRTTEAGGLFGYHDQLNEGQMAGYDLSSPVLRPQQTTNGIAQVLTVKATMDKGQATAKVSEMAANGDEPMTYWADWERIQSPEDIELDELEDLFDAY